MLYAKRGIFRIKTGNILKTRPPFKFHDHRGDPAKQEEWFYFLRKSLIRYSETFLDSCATIPFIPIDSATLTFISISSI